MKRASAILYNLAFWLPFAVATGLCWNLSGPQDAWPAFYAFLPMPFFFVGAAFFMVIARIRALEACLAPDPGREAERALGPRTGLDDPVGWSRSLVGTRPRFVLTAAFLAVLPFLIVYQATQGSWRAAVGTAIVLAINQMMLLFALRRTSVPGRNRSSRPEAARPDRRTE
jgi:hypothetical protein